MKGFFQKLKRWFFKAIVIFFITSILTVILFKWVPVPFTPLMLIRNIEQWTEGTSATFTHNWVSMDKISPNLVKAVIVSEDQKFFEHFGFDVEAIEKAYEGNKKGKKIKGGSTITQQTAKNVFLWPQRSYVRKGFEVYFSFLIEVFWSKERIIEVYLNSIEMGDGVYGAEAASQHWFRKSAKKLSTYEAASIAAILPNPRKYKAIRSSNYVERRKNWIVRQMGYFGPLNFE
ncbi:monofunctional biosynthetic peptidoglycan transglycosylase [Lutibacter maritimus]|uniref:Biosynthetic peptidoglycan transglycosylase n=1 Tax=Lutibacter maritimus TaxID=593133 RepID=A0A1I6PE91_9FLAO|nr:monofunctional biosynthetic peptidoglycan transglycosylase [Lutibacter maritimus]SFS38532.1 monofunctional biosynthetic peptidoglycan transglycosylase [Lutibacter maritimus]